MVGSDSVSVSAVFRIPSDVAVALHSVQEDKAVIFLFTFLIIIYQLW